MSVAGELSLPTTIEFPREVRALPRGIRAVLAMGLSRQRLRERPPLWREGRLPFELAALRRDPIFDGEGVPPGRNRPVMLAPGYLAVDDSLAPMASWLRRSGYRTAHAGLRLNAGCARAHLTSLTQRLEVLVDEWGERAILIGHSRGGGLARLMAVERPDLVERLITLGTPSLDPLAVHPLLLLNIGFVCALGTLGIPGLFTRTCLAPSGCCVSAWENMRRPLQPHIPYLSIYSRSDGIVDWRACLDPSARHHEVDASHLGMAVHASVYRAIAGELA